MTTNATMDKAFEKEMEKSGMERDGFAKHPFLPLRDEVGNWVKGKITEARPVKVQIKKGKNKGKVEETIYFTLEVEGSNIKGVVKDSIYTISPAGLLRYQLTKGAEKKGLKLPYAVAIRYLGKDDEDRHQTEVFFPAAK